MPEVSGWMLLAAAFAILTVAVPPPSPSSGARLASAPTPPPLSVEVEPSTWWMEEGSNVTLSATWAGGAADCSVRPLWYRWSIGSAESAGTLGSSNGSQVTFTADTADGGVSSIVVRAAASVRCPGYTAADSSQAASEVTVAAPLLVRNVALSPNPAAPGVPVTLTGTVTGGDAPYEVRVAWGNGATAAESVSGPGNFSAQLTYRSVGAYAARVTVFDAAGEATTAVAPERENISEVFAAAITATSWTTDVGEPVTFGVSEIASPSNVSAVFACENAASLQSNATGEGGYSCTFDRVGPAVVSFEGVGARWPYPVASASFAETVVAAPSLDLVTPPIGEVGATTYVRVSVVGGVLPVEIRWSVVGSPSNGTEQATEDGPVLLPLTAGRAGAFVLSLVATDALGVQSAPVQESVTFEPALGLAASADAARGADAAILNLTASTGGGVPPYAWSVVADIGLTNASRPAGLLDAPGRFGWNASCPCEGVVAVVVLVVDAVGGDAEANLSVEAAAPLAVAISARSDAPGDATLNLSITGGVGPYTYRWNDSQGDSGNGSVPGDGAVPIEIGSRTGGSVDVVVSVTDAYGVSVESATNLSVLAPAPPLSEYASPGDLYAGLAAVAVIGLTAWGALRWRRGHVAVPAAPLDAEAILREVIEPSDGVDRAMVEMLAEERGLSPEVIRSSLDRLKAEGKLRSGRGFDGEEVFAWVERPLP